MAPTDQRSDIRSLAIVAAPAQVDAAMSPPARLARWWGPDGTDHPNESRFTRRDARGLAARVLAAVGGMGRRPAMT